MKMDEYSMYAVYDVKAEVYDIPFFSRSDLMAKRKFIIDCEQRDNTVLANFKDDFELHKLGTFKPNTGEFFNISPIVVIGGKEIKK